MWPQPFLWLTIADQCWPGVIKLYSTEVSWFWGYGRLKFLKNAFFVAICAIESEFLVFSTRFSLYTIYFTK